MAQPTVRMTVELNTIDVEWLRETYGKGSTSWTLSMLLENFRTAHSMTPQDYAKIAADNLKLSIEEHL